MNFFGDAAKQVSSGLGQISGQVTGAATTTVENVIHGVEAALPKLMGKPMQKGSADHDDVTAGIESMEIKILDRPAVAIMSGVEVEKKMPQILSLLEEKVDSLILSGPLIYPFLKAKGHSVGAIAVSDQEVELANAILQKAEGKGVTIVLPNQVQVADTQLEGANIKIVDSSGIPDGWFPIGEASMDGAILNASKTVLWSAEPFGNYQGINEGIERMVEGMKEKEGVKVYSLESFGNITVSDDKSDNDTNPNFKVRGAYNMMSNLPQPRDESDDKKDNDTNPNFKVRGAYNMMSNLPRDA